MAPQKKSATTRAEAGLVEEDFEPQPNDQVVAEGEQYDPENQDLENPLGPVTYAPSAKGNPYMSEEEQDMEMTPVVMGPPQYGSPDPLTAASRLVPVTNHPLAQDTLPEDSAAKISEDFGADVEGYTHASTDTSHTILIPPPEIVTDASGQGEEGGGEGEGDENVEETSYEERTKAELLAEAQSRDLDVTAQNSKAEIIEALENDDQSQSQ